MLFGTEPGKERSRWLKVDVEESEILESKLFELLFLFLMRQLSHLQLTTVSRYNQRSKDGLVNTLGISL